MAPPDEERRLVTALFCDLVGFTPLSEQLDPEEVRDIQSAYFEQMRQQIERYGGTVEKYAGDAVLALFGAPIAHEDDAERAVLCALGMQQAIEPVAERTRSRWNIEPAIRVGVNTGEVVSGIWEAGGRQDVAVTGDSVNTAARIQAAAEPGEVLVGLETMRLTKRRIRYGERRDLVLKGKAGTVPGYPAVGLREQFGERWETSEYATPLVGRYRELLQLLDAWIRAQGGDGQLVTVVGDAGVGKSRLISELLERIGSSTPMRVVRGRCLSYGQEISLWLIGDILRGLFAIKEQDPPGEVRARVNAGVAGLLGESNADTQAEAMDVLGEVLGLPPGDSMVAQAGAQIRRQALIRSLRLLLRALSERASSVIVLEDLHWIDEASREVLREILSDVPGLRLLVLAAQRPGLAPPWGEWGWTERMTLRPLGDQDATALAGAVLGGMRLSPELEQYVGDRAGGNPFFVEEMLRALQETNGLMRRDGTVHLVLGAAERLPSTLTEVLLARLDRLDPQVRSVAQVASVIGRSFAVRLLARVMDRDVAELDPALTALQQAEIAFPRRGSDIEYVFKHVSMREVAYNTLVHKRRQELHLQTARAIAALYPTDEYVEMIAYHHSRTEENEEATEWLERAGDRAAEVYAVETAITHYEEALERLGAREGGDVRVARLEEKLGGVLMMAGRYDEALAFLGRAVELYRRERDLEAAGRTTARIGLTHRYRGTPEDGIAQVEPMVELLTWGGPSEALASLHLALAQLYFLTGRYREMLAAATRAVELARAIGDNRLLGDAEERRGAALALVGHPEAARPVLEGALPLIQAGGDAVTLWRALNNLGEACKITGEIDQCRRYVERGLNVAERIGNPDQTAFILGNLAKILIIQGDWNGAREHLERGMAPARSAEGSVGLSSLLTAAGQLSLWEGDWEEAVGYLGETAALASKAGDRQMRESTEVLLAELDVLEGRLDAARVRLEALAQEEDAQLPLVLPVLAWSHLERGDPESVARAEALAAEAVNRAQEQKISLVDALRVHGMVLARLGSWQQAESVFAQSTRLAHSMPYPYAEARILAEHGLMFAAGEDRPQGRQLLESALEIFRRLGAKRDVERTSQALGELDAPRGQAVH